MPYNQLKSFKGKTALITGGSSGIGLAISKNLASQGANIWILGRDRQKLDEACVSITQSCKSSQQKVRTIQADVVNLDEITQSLELVIQEDELDLLINSAGVTFPGLFHELEIDIFRQMMEVNYFGTLNVTKALVPDMIKRGHGHIVNISSVVGIHGLYGYSAYGPSKFAVRGLSDALRYELEPLGIKVSVVFPADTQTPQLEFENKHKPLVLKHLSSSNTSVSSPESVAEQILRGVQKGKYLIFPSFDTKLLFFIYGLLPGYSIYRFVDFLMMQARRKAAEDLAGK